MLGAMTWPIWGGLLKRPSALTRFTATVTSGRRSPLMSTGIGAFGMTPTFGSGRFSRCAVWVPEVASIS